MWVIKQQVDWEIYKGEMSVKLQKQNKKSFV